MISKLIIRPSASIRNSYNEISGICKTTGEPVFLTKNGEGDLVVLSLEAYEKREKMLEIREKLIESEEARKNGEKFYTLEETDELLENTIRGVAEKNGKYEV